MEPMKPMKPMEPMEPMKGMEPMKPMKPMDPWWPAEWGQPNSAGSQNALKYAYFANAHRLAVQKNGQTTFYDTADHRIGGVAQQQHNNDGGATFTSQHGEVELAQLKQVDG